MATPTSIALRSSTPQKTGFRGDIQGLRAIAVLLVVVYHSGVGAFAGGYVGVDVFFVISGFLITTHLLETLQQHGTADLAGFYARRARRILPAAFTVLLLSLVAAVLWMPPLQLGSVFRGAVATALYVPNMLFGIQGTNYLEEGTTSLFQHYWSLGVEEQFYLVWPAVLLLGHRVCKRSERALFLLVAALVMLSFVLCLVMMRWSPPLAFFSLPTRAWELGAGGLVALLLRSGAGWITRPVMGLLAWVGVGTLVLVAVVYDSTTPYPSYYAAAPVLATALVIVGGMSGRINPSRLLSVRPLQFIGLISYSLYLVHWPLQVIPQAAAGQANPLPAWATLALGAVSVPLAYALYRVVEDPLRRPRRITGSTHARTLVLVVCTSGLVVMLTFVMMLVAQRMPLDAGRPAAAVEPTASPTGTGFVPSNLTPSLREAAADNAAIYDDGCLRGLLSTDASACRFGAEEAAPVVVLFGDSHAASWFPALHDLAEAGRIMLEVNTKSSCPSADVPVLRTGAPFPACEQWRDGVMKRIDEERPDVVLLANYGVTALQGGNDDFAQRWERGLTDTIAAMPEGTAVGVIADVPDMQGNPSICLSDHLEDTTACDRPPDEVLDPAVAAAERAAAEAGAAELLDMNRYLCGQSACPTIIGNQLVYRDAHHLTATFSASLAGPLWEALAPLLR
ncbi:acyltransferase [Kocuria flava]|uniref:acyltransferase family protein n=1 Tax=Kocuria flava TaxID=446860 RepID=UPI001FF4AB5D|nr:acyltransferase family protein [Kocuria flava]MCJ8505912.1 acyltransferase [Kocuria flava]